MPEFRALAPFGAIGPRLKDNSTITYDHKISNILQLNAGSNSMQRVTKNKFRMLFLKKIEDICV